MKVTEMAAGRELDKLIAERVFGQFVREAKENFRFNPMPTGPRRPEVYVVVHEVRGEAQIKFQSTAEHFAKGGGYEQPLPHYSTEITDAWMVVEKLRPLAPRPCQFSLDYTRSHSDGVARWHACFGDSATEGKADTAPLAICRAALLAVGIP